MIPIETLNLAAKIEQKISECYKNLSRLAPSPTHKETLKNLAFDEINHMNALKTGMVYAFKNPDIFNADKLSLEEMQEGFHAVLSLLKDLEEQRISYNVGLRRIFELEIILEQVHLKSVMSINDAIFKKLFEALCEGDRMHRKKLLNFIDAQD